MLFVFVYSDDTFYSCKVWRYWLIAFSCFDSRPLARIEAGMFLRTLENFSALLIIITNCGRSEFDIGKAAGEIWSRF